MKKLTNYFFAAVAFFTIPGISQGQNGATFTVATTPNQGEIAIDYDLTGYAPGSSNISGAFWAEHQVSGYRVDTWLNSTNTANTINLQLIENGTYTYCSRIYDAQGYQDSLTGTITITNGLPSCGTTITPTQNTSTQYDFTANNAFAGISANPNYYWSKNPYEAVSMSYPGQSIGNTNSISYDFSTTYSGYHPFAIVMLTVSDQNCHSTVIENVDITGGCYAYFETQQTLNPSVIVGQNLSVGNNLSYTWDFGDGGSSTLQYPTHTYSSVGWFTVSLTVDDGNGCNHTWQWSIEIVTKSGTQLIITDENGTNSIAEQKENLSDLAIFPNPSYGKFTIQFNAKESKSSIMNVLDLQGRTVHSVVQNINPGDNKFMVDLEGVKPGIYFIKLDEHIVEKIIIE